MIYDFFAPSLKPVAPLRRVKAGLLLLLLLLPFVAARGQSVGLSAIEYNDRRLRRHVKGDIDSAIAEYSKAIMKNRVNPLSLHGGNMALTSPNSRSSQATSASESSLLVQKKVNPLLEKFRADGDGVRFRALGALTKLGKPAIPFLVKALNEEKGYSRIYVARALREIDPSNQQAEPALMAMSTDSHEDRAVRRYAVYVLALQPSGVPALARMLGDPDAFVERSAAFALSELFDISGYLPAGYRAVLTNALAPFIASLGSPDELVRGIAAESLERTKGDLDFAFEYVIKNSPNKILIDNAKEVMDRRQEGIKPPTHMQMTIKPTALEEMKKKKNFLHGTLGVIYAMMSDGKPVEDFRSVPGSVGEKILRITVNTETLHASTGVNNFNPYQDLH